MVHTVPYVGPDRSHQFSRCPCPNEPTPEDYVRPEERDLYKEFRETLYADLGPEGLLDKTRRSIERARSHAHSVLHRSVNQFRRLQTRARLSSRDERGRVSMACSYPWQCLYQQVWTNLRG